MSTSPLIAIAANSASCDWLAKVRDAHIVKQETDVEHEASLPGTYRISDGTPVGFSDALGNWSHSHMTNCFGRPGCTTPWSHTRNWVSTSR